MKFFAIAAVTACVSALSIKNAKSHQTVMEGCVDNDSNWVSKSGFTAGCPEGKHCTSHFMLGSYCVWKWSFVSLIKHSKYLI